LDNLSSELIAAAVVTVALNAFTLGFGLSVFRPGPTGYFARHGPAVGWRCCVATMCGLVFVGLAGVPIVVSAILSWVLALGFFQLTFRQAIKLNIIFALVYIVLVMGVAAAR